MTETQKNESYDQTIIQQFESSSCIIYIFLVLTWNLNLKKELFQAVSYSESFLKKP